MPINKSLSIVNMTPSHLKNFLKHSRCESEIDANGVNRKFDFRQDRKF